VFHYTEFIWHEEGGQAQGQTQSFGHIVLWPLNLQYYYFDLNLGSFGTYDIYFKLFRLSLNGCFQINFEN